MTKWILGENVLNGLVDLSSIITDTIDEVKNELNTTDGVNATTIVTIQQFTFDQADTFLKDFDDVLDDVLEVAERACFTFPAQVSHCIRKKWCFKSV